MQTIKSWTCPHCGCPNWDMKATVCEGNCGKPRPKNAKIVKNIVVGTTTARKISYR